MDIGPRGAVPECPGPPTLPCSVDEVNAINSSGRYVAFESYADNLVPGDTNKVKDIFVRDMKTGKTLRVSVASDGSQAVGVNPELGEPTDVSRTPSISANGRYVAFSSWAPNLVSGDTNLTQDVFVHDIKKKSTIRVSVATGGDQVGTLYGAKYPAISPDGRHVAFSSSESAFVPGDTNGVFDVFMHDIDENKTIRASVATGGRQSENASFNEHPLAGTSISDDGRFIAFQSNDGTLVEGDTNGAPDIFVHDVKKNETTRVSVSSDGSQGIPVDGFDSVPGTTSATGFTDFPSISSDGRYVTFQSAYPNLIPNDTNFLVPFALSGKDIFVHDRKTHRTERVNVSSSGEEAFRTEDRTGAQIKGEGFWEPLVNSTGRYVTFHGPATNLSSDIDDNEGTSTHQHAFIYDRRDGDVDILDRDNGGAPVVPGALNGPVSATGRYALFNSSEAAGRTQYVGNTYRRDLGPDVGAGRALAGGERLSLLGVPEFSLTRYVIALDATDDVGGTLRGEGANLYGASLAYRPQHEDLFAAIELEYMLKVIPGASPIFYGLRFETGRKSYEVRATSLGYGAFGLFDCTGSRPTCTKVADVRGGYGTTGMRVVFSLQLEEIGLEDGGELENVEAFSGLGSYMTGATRILDRMAIK
ncbi:MAG: TolB family protein [Actinomycetota bacterium]